MKYPRTAMQVEEELTNLQIAQFTQRCGEAAVALNEFEKPVFCFREQAQVNASLYHAEQRAHRSTRRWNTAYRWLALTGWALAVTALAMRPAEAADMTLPKGMLACDSREAWADQSHNLGAGLTILSPGCVFTNRDLSVEVIDFKVFSGTEVYVRDVDLTIFVDGGVLR